MGVLRPLSAAAVEFLFPTEGDPMEYQVPWARSGGRLLLKRCPNRFEAKELCRPFPKGRGLVHHGKASLASRRRTPN
jgi:hypothetical protein